MGGFSFGIILPLKKIQDETIFNAIHLFVSAHLKFL